MLLCAFALNNRTRNGELKVCCRMFDRTTRRGDIPQEEASYTPTPTFDWRLAFYYAAPVVVLQHPACIPKAMNSVESHRPTTFFTVLLLAQQVVDGESMALLFTVQPSALELRAES